jgi:LysM repeat protein
MGPVLGKWLVWSRAIRAAIGGAVLGAVCALAATVAIPPVAGAATVRVQPGQTLSGIAAANGTTVAALAAANGITNVDHVVAGTELVLPSSPSAPASAPSVAAAPGSSTVVVRPGDTLTAIAARYGISVAALAAANGITNVDHVVAGTRLVIPNPATPSPATLPSSTALASFSVPASSGSTTSGSSPSIQLVPGQLPPQLTIHPDRVALRPLFVKWASQMGEPAPLLQAMCWWESGWQNGIVSSTGAMGIGQLEPSTVAAMRIQLQIPTLNPRVASDNIEMAAAFLHDLLVDTANNTTKALAGYYQGLNSLQHSGMFPATQQYVNGIVAYLPYFN